MSNARRAQVRSVQNPNTLLILFLDFLDPFSLRRSIQDRLAGSGGQATDWPDGQKQDTLGGQRIGAPAHPVMEPTRHEDISRCNRGQVTLPKLQAAQPTVPWPHNSRLQDDSGWVLLDAGSQSVGLWSLVHRLADA